MPTPLRGILLVLAVSVAACGGGGSRSGAPTPTTTPDPRIPAGAVVTVLNGETGAPVPGATVNVGGRMQTTDGGGAIRLAEPVAQGTPVDITAPGMLDRQTTLREAGTQFLWPKTTANGIDENYTATLVYTSAGRTTGPVGTQPLLRVGLGASVVIVPSAAILADDRAHDFHREAVEQLTAIVGGAVRFRLEAAAPASGVVFTTRIEPGHPTCAQNTRGFATSNLRNSEIVGGEVVFCDDQIARSATVTHELGHTFGLRHSPDARDLMFGTFVRGRTPEFGPRETLIMNLMLKRPPGNRFPDSDRAAGAAGLTGRLTVVCD